MVVDGGCVFISQSTTLENIFEPIKILLSRAWRPISNQPSMKKRKRRKKVGGERERKKSGPEAAVVLSRTATAAADDDVADSGRNYRVIICLISEM